MRIFFHLVVVVVVVNDGEYVGVVVVGCGFSRIGGGSSLVSVCVLLLPLLQAVVNLAPASLFGVFPPRSCLGSLFVESFEDRGVVTSRLYRMNGDVLVVIVVVVALAFVNDGEGVVVVGCGSSGLVRTEGGLSSVSVCVFLLLLSQVLPNLPRLSEVVV